MTMFVLKPQKELKYIDNFFFSFANDNVCVETPELIRDLEQLKTVC